MTWQAQNVFKKRNLVISPKQQNAWGTPLVDADLTYRLRFDPGAYASVTRSYRSDRDKTGKGHPFATRRVKTDQDLAFSLTLDVDDFLAGWVPAFLMGADTVTGAGPYTHLFTFQQTSGTAKVTTIYEEHTDDLKRKLEGVGINNAEFSGSGRGVVQCRLDMIGSGRVVSDPLTALPALPTIKEVLASDAVVLLGNPGAPVAIDADRVLSWTVSLTQDISANKAPGSGLYASSLRIGQPSAKLAMTIAAKEADDLIARTDGETETEVQINIATAADAMLKFRFPSTYLSQAQPASDTNQVVIQIESNEDSIIKKPATELVEVTVINSVAQYLALGA